ncbi:hypothetical protein CERSUDRAFT_100376 [Gelatoporia subvermispora B]|uniref:Uncharacterized protein n=1 Tax=Ceriporiopsis subvermispora (strain B) TaxID=914234 RepID=M2P847_CERS8|nr:hypothetical protein CERSUDRAFT_100376 [Gelatoporia subvermispora B]
MTQRTAQPPLPPVLRSRSAPGASASAAEGVLQPPPARVNIAAYRASPRGDERAGTLRLGPTMRDQARGAGGALLAQAGAGPRAGAGAAQRPAHQSFCPDSLSVIHDRPRVASSRRSTPPEHPEQIAFHMQPLATSRARTVITFAPRQPSRELPVEERAQTVDAGGRHAICSFWKLPEPRSASRPSHPSSRTLLNASPASQPPRAHPSSCWAPLEHPWCVVRNAIDPAVSRSGACASPCWDTQTLLYMLSPAMEHALAGSPPLLACLRLPAPALSTPV